MLGRKDYTQAEFDHGQTAIKQQLAAHKKLAATAKDAEAQAALADFDRQFFNNMVLVLDRLYVHRIRAVTGKDGNPLNEVEMLSDSIMNNNGVFHASTVLKIKSDESVTKIQFGDEIRLTAAQFDRLSKAFFAELKAKFV